MTAEARVRNAQTRISARLAMEPKLSRKRK